MGSHTADIANQQPINQQPQNHQQQPTTKHQQSLNQSTNNQPTNQRLETTGHGRHLDPSAQPFPLQPNQPSPAQPFPVQLVVLAPAHHPGGGGDDQGDQGGVGGAAHRDHRVGHHLFHHFHRESSFVRGTCQRNRSFLMFSQFYIN